MDVEETYQVSSGTFHERTVVYNCNGTVFKLVYTQIVSSNGSNAGWSSGYYQQDQYGGWTGGTVNEGPGTNPYYTPRMDLVSGDENCVWMDGQRQCP